MKRLKSALFAMMLAAVPGVAMAETAAPPVAAPVEATVAPAATETKKASADQATLPAAPAPLKQNPLVGQPVDRGIGLQPQVTANGQTLTWLHNSILMPIITVISLFVLALMLWVMARYRRKANPTPSTVSHNTVAEVAWTVIPIFILVFISIFSVSLLKAQYKPASKNAITLKAIGNQWFWDYEYPDHGVKFTANPLTAAQAKAADEPYLLATDKRVVLPVDTDIRVIVTAADVIHNWAVPAFAAKMDAVPGRLNEFTFNVLPGKEGVYYGQCSELCGKGHGYMPIAVEIVSKQNFERWVLSKGGKTPSAVVAAAPAPATAAPAAAAPVASTNSTTAAPAAANATR